LIVGVYQLLKSRLVAALRLVNQETIPDTVFAFHHLSPMCL
jgi:hypothetical protein